MQLLNFAYRVNQLAIELTQQADATLSSIGSSYQQFLILSLINQFSVSNQKQLAHAASLTSAGVSHTISQLVDHGWVVKQAAEDSKREVRITITTLGKSQLNEMHSLLEARLQQILPGGIDYHGQSQELLDVLLHLQAD